LTSRTLPPAVAEVVQALRGLAAPWAVAGGWAIDLALGRETRAHADVDVAVFRADQRAVRAALPRREFRAVVGGALVPWPPDVWLAPPVHEVHVGPDPAGGPAVELLLDERDGTDWVYRRDPFVRRPFALALREGPGGVRLLAPEIVLLYKSTAPRPADEHDRAVARPLLDAEARTWLGAALVRARPDHPWAAALDVTA
jgi:hypothetical protein